MCKDRSLTLYSLNFCRRWLETSCTSSDVLNIVNKLVRERRFIATALAMDVQQDEWLHLPVPLPVNVLL